MSVWKRSSICLIVLSVAVFFLSCNNDRDKDKEKSKLNSSTEISLTTGPNNLCVQSGVEGGKAVVDTNGATWNGPAAGFTVAFGSTTTNCPVSPPPNASCSFSASNGQASTGALAGNSGNTYTINSITNSAGQEYCHVSGDGLIMK